jgi:hypothetical protein
MNKKSNHSGKGRSSSRLTSQTAQRLASYSMAAGLGAFGCGEAVHAAIVYTDVPDIVLMPGDAGVELNLDNDPTGKLDVQFRNNGGGIWYASGRFVGLPLPGDPIPESYSYALTRFNAFFPEDPNHAYYIRSFHPNEQIGPVGDGFTFKAGRQTNSPQYGNGILQTGLRSPYAPPLVDDFGDQITDQFAGMAIRDPDDGLHFGWVRLRAELLTTEVAPYYALKWTLYDWAYETELDTPILAGAKSAAVPGDYNNNGEIDAADYTTWRDQLGQSATLPNSDPTDVDNEVTQAEYNFWKSQFGVGGGSGGTAIDGASVPEPTSLALLAAGFGAFVSRRRR